MEMHTPQKINTKIELNKWIFIIRIFHNIFQLEKG